MSNTPCFEHAARKPSKEAGHWRRAALQGLDDDAGERRGVFADQRLGRLEVIERRHQQTVLGVRGPGTGELRLGKIRQPGREQAGDPGLVGAVVGALELEDPRPAGEGAGQALAVHGGLGTRGTKAQALGRRRDPRDLLGQIQRPSI
jgi:hypothetical protein